VVVVEAEARVEAGVVAKAVGGVMGRVTGGVIAKPQLEQ